MKTRWGYLPLLQDRVLYPVRHGERAKEVQQAPDHARCRERRLLYRPSSPLRGILGTQDAALILEFLLGWDGKQWNSDGWIHKSAIELEAETGLSKYQQGRVIKILLKFGIIEKKLMRVPAKNHFRVKKPVLQERWIEWIQANPAPVKKRRTVSEEPRSQLASNQPTTTYITHDDTHSPTASVKNSPRTEGGNDFESIGRIRMRMARNEALRKIREKNPTNNPTPSISSGDNPTISGTS